VSIDLSRTPLAAGATRRVARYLSSSRFDALPPRVVDEAVRALVNWAGCAIGGAHHESVDIALASFAPFAGPAQAALPGRGDRTDCLLAALLDGIASHVLDFDDTHPEVLVHPSGPVAAALFPLAEFRASPGAELVNAFVAGVEVECRVARAVMPAHYGAGWHITGTAGVIGAAAGCAQLLGLDEIRSTWALGIAATQAAGLREMFGSMCKSFHVGRAAQGGLAAALLAQKRFTSAESALEGACGFIHVLSTSPVPEALCMGLGEDYELLRNTYKPYACGLVIHPSLDGCIQLRDRHQLRGPEIERVDLVVNPLALELTGKPAPSTGLEGKFSVFHAAAVAILDGAGGEAQFSDERVKAADVVGLRAKVRARVDPSLDKEQALVSILRKDGSRHELRVEHCVGSLQRPLTDAELDAKFLALSEHALGDRAPVALAALRGLPEARDAGEIARRCATSD
jgi:2-methylcitrate dehydratase PrpD